MHPVWDKPFSQATEVATSSIDSVARVTGESPAVIALRQAVGQMHDEYDAKTEELRRKVEGLELQLTKQGGPLAPVSGRAAFEIIPDFTPETHLSETAQKLYTQFWEWMNQFWDTGIEPLTQGRGNQWGGEFPGKIIHSKSLRNVQTFSHACLFAMYQWGDPRAAKALSKCWRGVLNPARMATEFTAETVDHSLELKGVPFFPYHGADSGTPGVSGDSWRGTFKHWLEEDLQRGAIGQAKLGFRHNVKHGYGAEYKLLRTHADNYQKILEHVLREGTALKKPEAIAFLKGAKTEDERVGWSWCLFGHTINHPSESRFAGHYTECLDLDLDRLEPGFAKLSADEKKAFESNYARHKAAYEKLGTWLEADFHYVEIDGRLYASFPHFVSGRQAARGGKPSSDAQDVTYAQESESHSVLSNLLDSPYHPDKQIEAMANTLHDIVCFGGFTDDNVAATIAGHGPASDDGKKVIHYKGKAYPSRWTTGRPTTVELPLQVSRGLAMVGSSFVKNRPEFEKNLRDMLGAKEALKYKRFAHRTALIFYVTPERLAG